MVVNLSERDRTHGLYKDTAKTSQEFKSILHIGKNWESLNTMQRESLEMIVLKISRILNGNGNWRDHWDDIVGYAQLGADSIKPTLPQVALDIAEAAGPIKPDAA